MGDLTRDRRLSVDAMAFDLLANAFLDVTGVLMRIDPEATKELLRLIQERMAASLDNPAEDRGAPADGDQACDLAVWKAGTAIRAAETVLSRKRPIQ